MKDRIEKTRRLETLLKEAVFIYRELIDNSESATERQDWRLDYDDVERAANYAGNQADRG